jgi:hypothetical protein
MRVPAPLRHLSELPRVARVPLALLALAAVQLFVLRRFDYSKAWLVHASMQEARAPRDPLALGDLHWDPARYQRSPALAPLRALVADHCAGKSSVATAECVSDLFARHFAHGIPAREFFDAEYSPAADLAEHLGGAPGHCVTRSGLLAAALLSAGFPARVVQLMPRTGGGPNVAEVWDAARGWVLVDPSFRVTIEGSDGTASAAAAQASPAQVRWRLNTALHEVVGAGSPINFGNLSRLVAGHLVYPDPWLYTRVGHRSAPAPFQARFVIVGPPSFRLGIVQPLLHIGITLALLGLLGSVLLALAGLDQRPVEPAADLPRPSNPIPASPTVVAVHPGRDAGLDPPGSAVA